MGKACLQLIVRTTQSIYMFLARYTSHL
uniref:Uncharacterized protein n=1 Tax=Arundo donax TaxID=35708 RepID=A0A0A8ZW04_ARUDO